MVSNKEVKYPQNLPLKVAIDNRGIKLSFLARKFGLSRNVMSQVVNGHYKGTNIVPLIKKELGIE